VPTGLLDCQRAALNRVGLDHGAGGVPMIWVVGPDIDRDLAADPVRFRDPPDD
jgi:hypothetical protein